MPSTEPPADVGLLAPGRAGSAAEEATSDAAYLRGLLDAEAALTRAQARLALVPSSAAESVARAAARHEDFDVGELALHARRGGNPVIPLVAALRQAVAGVDADAATYVHSGATSQDMWDTATMLVASRTLGPVLADLDATAETLAGIATEHRDTPMPARTLTQQAAPTTFGLKAVGWRSLVLDARERLCTVHGKLPAQLGGAAGTLAAFHPTSRSPEEAEPNDLAPRLLAAYAAECGLTEPVLPWHTLRTPVADLASALAFAAGALGKLAADVLVLSRTEIGEVTESAAGGSSAMPHKANPVRSTLIAASARQVPALTSVLYGSVAAEDERPPGAWHAEWQPLRETLRLVGGAARAAAELTSGLDVHPARMRENLDATGGLIITERLATVLAADLGRAEARAVLDRAMHRVTGEGVTTETALRDEQAVTATISTERLHELVLPEGYLGSAGALVDHALRRSGGAGPPTKA